MKRRDEIYVIHLFDSFKPEEFCSAIGINWLSNKYCSKHFYGRTFAKWHQAVLKVFLTIFFYTVRCKLIIITAQNPNVKKEISIGSEDLFIPTNCGFGYM